MIEWADITTDPTYQSKSSDEQQQVADRYFNQVIVPEIDLDKVDSAREQFNSLTGFNGGQSTPEPLQAVDAPDTGLIDPTLPSDLQPTPEVSPLAVDPQVQSAPPPESQNIRNLPTVGGVQVDLEAPLRLLATVQDTATNVGRAIADDRVSMGDAFKNTVEHLVGIQEVGGLEKETQRAVTAQANDPTTTDTKRAMLESAYYAALLASAPTSRAGQGIIGGPLAVLEDVLRADMPSSAKKIKLSMLKGFYDTVATNPIRQVKQQLTDPNSFTRSLATTIGGKSVTKIRNLNTPTAHLLSNLMGDTEVASGKMRGFDQAVWMRSGDFLTAIKDDLEPLKKKWYSEGITPEESFKLEAEIRSGNIVSPAAKALVKTLDRIGDYLVGAKVIPSKIKNWLPRSFNTDYLQTKEGAAEWGNLFKSKGYDQGYAEQMRINIIDRDGMEMFPTPRQKIALDSVTGQTHLVNAKTDGIADQSFLPSNLQNRVVPFEDSELLAFLGHSPNLDSKIQSYIHESVRYAEYVKRFGANNEKLNKHISNLVDEANNNVPIAKLEDQIATIDKQLEAGMEVPVNGMSLKDLNEIADAKRGQTALYAERQALVQKIKILSDEAKPISQDEIDHIYGVADTFLFKYKPLTDTPSGRALKAFNAFAVPAAHMATLSLGTIGSLSDPINVLFRASLRPSSSLQGVNGMAAHLTRETSRSLGLKNFVNEAEQTRAINELGIGMSAGIVDTMTQLSRGDTSQLSTLFFKSIFLHQWTRMMMVNANETGKAMIKGHLKDLMAGKGNAKAMQEDLANLGIDYKEGVNWMGRGGKIDDPFYDRIKQGGLKFITDTLMLPTSASLPLLHANPRYKALTILKSFPTKYGNTVLPRIVKNMVKGNAKEKAVTVAGLTVLISVGMAQSALKDQIHYGEEGNPHKKNWTIFDRLIDGANAVGLGGLFSVAKGATSPSTGVSPIENLIGPVATATAGLIKNTLNGDADKIIKATVKSIPFVGVNHHVAKTITKTVEDIVLDKTGSEKFHDF